MEKWCAYSHFNKKFPQNIGKLKQQIGNAGYIQYSEKQLYPFQCWDMNYVEIFDTLDQAIEFMLKYNSDETTQNIKETLGFEEVNNINWEKYE